MPGSWRYSGLSTKIKITALLLTVTAFVTLTWRVSEGVFNSMLGTITNVQVPDREMELINNLFLAVTDLQQAQQERIFSDSTFTDRSLERKSNKVGQLLDSLERQVKNDSDQVKRVEAVKKVLARRARLLDSYLDLRAEVLSSRVITRRMGALSALVSEMAAKTDTSVVTAQERVIQDPQNPDSIRAVIHPRNEGSFLKRLFSKRPERDVSLIRIISDKLTLSIDTLNIFQRDSALRLVTSLIDSMQAQQIQQNFMFVNRHMALARAEDRTMNELFALLHQVKNQELATLDQANNKASSLVSTGFRQLRFVIIAFLAVTLLLSALIFLDIVRGSNLRKQLQAAKDRAEHLGQVKQRFLANMSHELRTPLQSIVGFAEQIHQQSVPDPSMVEAIHKSSEHLLQIANESLDYSRIISGKFNLVMQPFNIRRELEDVSQIIRIQADAKSLKFEFSCDVDPHLTVLGDAFRLRQVLFNILGNAVKFTPDGIVEFIVRSKESEGNVHFRFIVRDSGPGIPTASKGSIFDAFEQSGGIAAHSGTGLGLNIVKELVALHKGTIEVNSAPDAGTTFSVYLAFQRSQAPLPHSAETPGSLLVPGPVILIDDDPFITHLCSSILRRYHIVHRIFPSAETFLSQSGKDACVMLIDIKLSGMNGLALCQWIRKENGSIRLVALTAQTLPEEQQAIMNAGFDSILAKPFHEREFISAIMGERADREGITCDLTLMKKMTLDDPQLLRDNLKVFIDETERDIDKVSSLLQNQDFDSITDIIHRLAGRAGQAGAGSLAVELRALEINLRRGECSGATQKITACCRKLDDLVRYLSGYSERIKTA